MSLHFALLVATAISAGLWLAAAPAGADAWPSPEAVDLGAMMLTRYGV